jgi:hypothetical protein
MFCYINISGDIKKVTNRSVSSLLFLQNSDVAILLGKSDEEVTGSTVEKLKKNEHTVSMHNNFSLSHFF